MMTMHFSSFFVIFGANHIKNSAKIQTEHIRQREQRLRADAGHGGGHHRRKPQNQIWNQRRIPHAHAHNIDGHIYVHSHPFSGTSNNPGHSHTPQQFQLIAHLSLLVMMVATLVAFALRLLGVSFIFKTQKPAVRQDAPIRIYGLRAPPVC